MVCKHGAPHIHICDHPTGLLDPHACVVTARNREDPFRNNYLARAVGPDSACLKRGSAWHIVVVFGLGAFII
jgi:hypothetical protein